MNKKFEDVKINTKRIPVTVKKPAERTPVSDVENHNPTRNIPTEDKYQFLDKRVKKEVGSEKRIFQTPVEYKTKRKSSSRGWILFLFILAFLGVAFYMLSTTFFHANVTVVAKNKVFELKNQKFSAEKEKTAGTVPFTLTMVSGGEYKDIVLTSSKEASDKAKGSITLYNEYSTKALKIAAGTFLADENGKSYKTDATATIPGYTLDKSKKIIPGQISVNITAFLPGEAYNGEPKSFTVTSYKGTDKFKKIYGKANTKMSGGATGLVYIMDDKQGLEIESMDFSKLKEKLLSKIEVPPGYVLYNDTVRYSIDFDKNLISKSPDTRLEVKGTASAMLLKESDLIDYIIDKLLPDISPKERAQIIKPDINGLKFNFSDENQIVDKEVKSFDFELSGNLPIKWNPYSEEMKKALAGKNKNEAPNIFKQDPGVSSAWVKIIPFWSKNLPSDTQKINIILQ